MTSRSPGRAGASACPRSAGPTPILRFDHETCGDGIVFDVTSNPGELMPVPNPVIKRLRVPEDTAAMENPIGRMRRRAFQPSGDLREPPRRPNQRMNMVRHNDPGIQLIEAARVVTIQESVLNNLCDPVISEPHWPQSRPVRYAVLRYERASRSHAFVNHPWHGARKPPGHELAVSVFRIPMGQLSAIEHALWAGGSACPTGISRRRAENVA